MAEQKANYTKPASQVDLEARLANGNENDSAVLSTFKTDGNVTAVEASIVDQYVGVSEDFSAYGQSLYPAHRAEKGPEAKLENDIYGEKADNSAGFDPDPQDKIKAFAKVEAEDEGDDESEKDDESDDDKKDKGGNTAPASAPSQGTGPTAPRPS